MDFTHLEYGRQQDDDAKSGAIHFLGWTDDRTRVLNGAAIRVGDFSAVSQKKPKSEKRFEMFLNNTREYCEVYDYLNTRKSLDDGY